MASVEPQQTVISDSGSISSPCDTLTLRAIASRRFCAPQVIAYWLMSAAIACCAARLISSGAAKSGNPCARLMASWSIACRVISRITDSVKRSVRALTTRFPPFAAGSMTAKRSTPVREGRSGRFPVCHGHNFVV